MGIQFAHNINKKIGTFLFFFASWICSVKFTFNVFLRQVGMDVSVLAMALSEYWKRLEKSFQNDVILAISSKWYNFEKKKSSSVFQNQPHQLCFVQYLKVYYSILKKTLTSERWNTSFSCGPQFIAPLDVGQQSGTYMTASMKSAWKVNKIWDYDALWS